MPRYEHRDGTSGKFWEIELSGNEFTVRYGAIGAKGREQIKSFATPELARREHDKLVAEKLRKGYAAVGGAADPAAALRRDFYVYNEATGMLVTSARLGGKGWDNGGKAWEKGVRNGDLIPVELVQDGPFVIRVVVGGGLEPQEAEEWVGRLDWKLRVPDGDLVVCGGPEYVLEDFDDEDDSPVAEFVRRMDIPRGEYRATLYTYLGGAALSERLGSLPDGSVVELDAAFIDEVEHGVERPAGLHRHRGTVRGGRLAVEEAFPTADAGRLNAALALSAQCEGDAVDVGDARLRDELLAALRENEFFENNPAVASGGTSVTVSKPEPVLLNVVAAEAFKRKFRDDWPLPEDDDE